jgi:hypothetical protein
MKQGVGWACNPRAYELWAYTIGLTASPNSEHEREVGFISYEFISMANFTFLKLTTEYRVFLQNFI